MKTIVVLSGKGGVGKSSIAGSLALVLADRFDLTALDCDTDTPNLHLVLGALRPYKKEELKLTKKASINNKCIACNLCYENCMFSAIDIINGKYKVNKYKCEGCNTCSIVCPVNAISLDIVHNADILYFKTKYGFELISGQLMVGESGTGKIVYEIRKRAKSEIALIDAPAGIGCPIISSLSGADYAVAVTEPTPAAFADLQRALRVAEHFNVPYGIVINRFDLNEDFSKQIEDFAKRNNIEIIAKIPYDKDFVDAIVNMTPIVLHKYKGAFSRIAERCIKNAGL